MAPDPPETLKRAVSGEAPGTTWLKKAPDEIPGQNGCPKKGPVQGGEWASEPKKGSWRPWRELPSRRFVLRDAHTNEGPTLLQPRWAMSFLRGPMTRSERRGAIEARRGR
jgi:hypothetical protein